MQGIQNYLLGYWGNGCFMISWSVLDCLAGEFHLRLRQLEKSLLQALNDAKGKILDDDSVITTLETLKQEAADISKKVEETDKVIAEIETVSQQYMPLSQVRGILTTSTMTVLDFEVFAMV